MKKALALLLAAGLLLGLAGCAQKAEQPAAPPAAQQPPPQPEKPVVKVGTEAAYPPFEWMDEKTGELKGFDMDLIRAIADEAGFKADIRNMAWDGLIPALLAKEIDLIISGMTITDERALAVTFSDPYFKSGQVIMSHKDAGIKGPDDLAGKDVSVQVNTTGQFAMEKLNEKLKGEGKKLVNIKKFKSTPDAINEVKIGGAVACVLDLPVAVEHVKANPGDPFVIGQPINVEYLGMAMRKEDTDLHAKINRALAAIKASGRYDDLYNQFFGK
ncbi:MAG: basic amino acid ABC transporter substrate-binding protein [Bacillota bacterium]